MRPRARRDLGERGRGQLPVERGEAEGLDGGGDLALGGVDVAAAEGDLAEQPARLRLADGLAALGLAAHALEPPRHDLARFVERAAVDEDQREVEAPRDGDHLIVAADADAAQIALRLGEHPQVPAGDADEDLGEVRVPLVARRREAPLRGLGVAERGAELARLPASPTQAAGELQPAARDRVGVADGRTEWASARR